MTNILNMFLRLFSPRKADKVERKHDPVPLPEPEPPQTYPPPLHIGARNSRVLELQKRLLKLDFPPGPLDGIFGPATEAALMNFQRSVDLPATGILDSCTEKKLLSTYKPKIDLSQVVRVGLVKQLFPQTPIANIQNNLPHVLAGLAEFDLTDRPMILMALATIRAETESFLPIREWKSRFNTSPEGHPFDLYDHRKDIGNLGPPDGFRFRGGGFPQLTGRYNYGYYGRMIGLNDALLTNPDLACDPEISGRLLAAFLKSKENLIRTALLDNSLKTARRLVNGGSHGLARFSETYMKGIQLIPEIV